MFLSFFKSNFDRIPGAYLSFVREGLGDIGYSSRWKCGLWGKVFLAVSDKL